MGVTTDLIKTGAWTTKDVVLTLGSLTLGFVMNRTPASVFNWAADFYDLYNHVRNCSLLVYQDAPDDATANITSYGVVSTGKEKLATGRVVVLGATTTTGQVKATVSTSAPGPTRIYYRPEATRIEDATAMATELATRRSVSTMSIIAVREIPEYLGRSLDIGGTTYFVVAERDTASGDAQLTLKTFWEQGGEVQLDNAQRADAVNVAATRINDTLADGANIGVLNTGSAVTHGFVRVYYSDSDSAPEHVDGLLWFNITTNKLNISYGGSWRTW
jgi:hypothetical protein